MSNFLRLTVVIPAYNEEQSLAPVVHEALAVLRGLGQTFEVLIVNDGSQDGTPGIANGLARDIAQVRVVHHRGNQGLGQVYRTGFFEARGDLITFLPSDGEFPPSYLEGFLARMADCDAVLGYVAEHQTPVREQLLAFGERLLLRLLFGPLPRFQGVFMLRREVLSRLDLQCSGRGWSILTELLIKLSQGGYRLSSAPTPTRPRLAGESKVSNWHTAFHMLFQILKLRRTLWLGKASLLAKES